MRKCGGSGRKNRSTTKATSKAPGSQRNVVFCHSCGTDLRPQNEVLHRGNGHFVVIHTRDPRDTRFSGGE